MFYRKNVGTGEAVARGVGGAVMAACSLTLAGATPLGLALAAGGACLALTGLVGFCPACALMGRKPLGPRP